MIRIKLRNQNIEGQVSNVKNKRIMLIFLMANMKFNIDEKENNKEKKGWLVPNHHERSHIWKRALWCFKCHGESWLYSTKRKLMPNINNFLYIFYI